MAAPYNYYVEISMRHFTAVYSAKARPGQHANLLTSIPILSTPVGKNLKARLLMLFHVKHQSLADTKTGKNLVENLFGINRAGNFAYLVGGLA